MPLADSLTSPPDDWSPLVPSQDNGSSCYSIKGLYAGGTRLGHLLRQYHYLLYASLMGVVLQVTAERYAEHKNEGVYCCQPETVNPDWLVVPLLDQLPQVLR